MTTEFNAVFKVTGANTAQAERETLAGIDRITQGGRRKLRDFSGEAQQILNQALSVPRNQAGALDLNLPELRQATQAQEARAIAAREVAEATLRAAKADGFANQEMRERVAAVRQLAAAEDALAADLRTRITVEEAIQRELNQTVSATDAVVAAQRRGIATRGSAVNSVGRERTAFIQLGQQLQDVTVQAQLGTNAFVIFSQQVPQAAFALSGLADSTNKTKAAVGSFATFLAGPWGAALFAATAVLGPYIARLFESEEAADESANAHETLADRLDITRNSYEEVIEAIREYNAEAAASAQTTLQLAQAASIAANARLDEAIATRQQIAASLELQANRQFDGSEATGPGGFVTSGQAIRVGAIEARLAANEAEISDLQRGVTNTGFSLAVEQARIQGDPAAAIAENYAVLREQLRGRITDTNDLRKALLDLNAQERADINALRDRPDGSSNRPDRSTNRRLRELDRLREFAADAERQIAEVGNRFVEIPSGVALVNRSVTDLDNLIAELGKRQPPDFRQLIDQAQDLREQLSDFGVEGLLNREAKAIETALQQQLTAQRLVLAGREDEAEILRILAQLQAQYGEEALLLEPRIRAAVEAYADAQEGLQRLSDQQAAFLDATQSLRQELEGLFSGEGADFERIFRQLRARLQVEEIFGDGLRKLEQSVRKDFGAAVDELTLQTRRGETALEAFTDALLGQAARIAGAGTVPSAQQSIGQLFDAEFGSGGAANDNEIIVNAYRRAVENTIAGTSLDEFTARSAAVLTDPLLRNLPPEIAAKLAPVLNNAVGGFLAAGPIGGILGALDGADIGGDGGSFDRAIGGLLKNAQQAAVFGSILNSIGIGGGSAESQLLGSLGGIGGGALGGAIGALGSAGGPIGALIGTLAGQLLGSVLGNGAAGSATLGGTGGRLGVTGTGGGSGTRRDQASQLGDSVAEAINQVASALGATVDASRASLSVGLRDDDIRIDASGRGRTKIGDGARDFGQNAEAALLFATQDLINDGVIAGLTASEERLFRAGADIDAAIQDVLDFRSVFNRLGAFNDPLGEELRALNTEFERFIELFDRANVSVEERQQLEELYERERAELIADATDRVAGSLKSLIDDLTIGDSGLSLRARRENALAEFDPLAARVAAGDASAFDDFEQAARALLEIERELFASSGGYFERFDQIVALSRGAVAAQEAALTGAAGLPSPFGNGVQAPVPGGVPTLGPGGAPGVAPNSDRFSETIARNTQDVALINSEQRAILSEMREILSEMRSGIDTIARNSDRGGFIGQPRSFAA